MRTSTLKSLGLIAIGAISATGIWHTLNAASAASNDTYRQLNLFGDVFDRIRSDYVEKPNEEKLIEAAVNGMLASLDPHSSYMSPKRFKEMRQQTRGEFGGLGIEVTMSEGLIKVVTPIDDTPAARAGLLANDLISHLDGERVRGMTLNQAVSKMRGKVNTPLTLTIIRKGAKKPFDVKIVRDIIRVKSVKFSAEGDIGYIRITTFSEQTQIGLDKAMRKLKEQIGADKIKGYIIDLRNNPGGLLDQAISVSDTFLERGEVVSTRGRNASETQRFTARKGDLADNKPIIVLINGGSASASEIVAGALRDHKRATILGTRSFGKGSVQSIIPLGGQGAIRLTTARYYTPSGTSIQATGIVPDIVIEQDLPPELAALLKNRKTGEAALRGHLTNRNKDGKKDESGSSSFVPQDRKKDKQFHAAIKLLHGVDPKVVLEEYKPKQAKAPESKPMDDDKKKKAN